MMGRLESSQDRFFYNFCLDDVVPSDHLVRRIDAVLDLSWLHGELDSYYSQTGRPSIDPELMIRMMIIGYVFVIRSERQLCSDVQVNLAYRWFCRLGLEDTVPDHSVFSRARHERFRESDVFRQVFETVVDACIREGLVGGQSLSVDASYIKADVDQIKRVPGDEPIDWPDDKEASRAVTEYLDALDQDAPDENKGSRRAKPPKAISLTDPHIPVWDKSNRKDGTFSRADFEYDKERDVYTCPRGNTLKTTGSVHEDTLRYLAKTKDCRPCPLKKQCCPNTPFRKVPRDINEDARDYARALAKTKAFKIMSDERKKVEMAFAHMKNIFRLDRLRLRGLSGDRDEVLLTATAQNLRKLARYVNRPPPIPATS